MLLLTAAGVCLTIAAPASAQIGAAPLPLPEYDNSVSFGLSYGSQIDRDAEFWGWSGDYGRRIFDRWVLAGAITWDRETERKQDEPDARTETFNAIGTISYALNEWVSLTTGLSKGFADTSRGSGMRFTNGDWGTGVAVGFSTPGPLFDRDSVGFSASYEYNISQHETGFSVDVTFGLSF